MNYQYIEQLLCRYFQADTTVAEERILRDFFAQDDIPARFARYRGLFAGMRRLGEERVSSGFDKRLLAALGQQTVQRRGLASHLAPLFKAAASVAIVLAVGLAAEQGMRTEPQTRVLTPAHSQTVGVEMSELGSVPLVGDTVSLTPVDER